MTKIQNEQSQNSDKKSKLWQKESKLWQKSQNYDIPSQYYDLIMTLKGQNKHKKSKSRY